MKKLLTIILALFLCLSTAVVFSSCDSESDDVEVNAPVSDEAPTEPEATEPPSPTNKEVATKSFNKIDIAQFVSVTDNSLEEIQKVSAKAEANMSTPDGKGSVTAVVKDGLFYVALTEEGYDSEEVFGKIGEEKISAFALVDGVWEMVEEIDLSGSGDSMSSIAANPTELMSKIKIPALKDEHLTEKNDMLLVSNDYIYELIAENLAVVYGDSIPAEELEEAKASIKESLNEAGLEVFIATGAEEITKLAISVAPADTEAEEFKSAYIEIALTDDAKALQSIKAEWTAALGETEMNEVKTSKVELTTVLADNELVGAKAKAEIYGCSYRFHESSVSPMPDDALDDMFSGSFISTRSETVLLTKTDISVDLDFSQLETENGKVLALNVDHAVTSGYKVTSTLDPETFEWNEEIAKIDNLSEYADSNLTADASITMNGTDRAEFALKVLAGDEEVTASGYLAIGDVEFPAIPDALKSKLN